MDNKNNYKESFNKIFKSIFDLKNEISAIQNDIEKEKEKEILPEPGQIWEENNHSSCVIITCLEMNIHSKVKYFNLIAGKLILSECLLDEFLTKFKYSTSLIKEVIIA